MRVIEFRQKVIFSSYARKEGENFDNEVKDFLDLLFQEQIVNFCRGFVGTVANVPEFLNYKEFDYSNIKTNNVPVVDLDFKLKVYDETFLKSTYELTVRGEFFKEYTLDHQLLSFTSRPPLPPIRLLNNTVKVKKEEDLSSLPKSEQKDNVASSEQNNNSEVNDLLDSIYLSFKDSNLNSDEFSYRTKIPFEKLGKMFNGCSSGYSIEDLKVFSERASKVADEANLSFNVSKAAPKEILDTRKTEKVEDTVDAQVEKYSVIVKKIFDKYDGFDIKNICTISVGYLEVIDKLKNGDLKGVSQEDAFNAHRLLNDAVVEYLKKLSDKAKKETLVKSTNEQRNAEKVKHVEEIKKNLKAIMPYGIQKDYKGMLECRQDEISSIMSGRITHLSLYNLETYAKKSADLLKHHRLNEAKETLEAVSSPKPEAVKKPIVTGEEALDELRAMIISSKQPDEVIAKAVGISMEFVDAIIKRKVDSVQLALVPTILEYFKEVSKTGFYEYRKEKVKDLKDLHLLDIKEDASDKEDNVHESGVKIPQFSKDYITKARDFIKSKYNSSKQASFYIHKQYFTDNKRKFSLISINPNEISKLCGIDFQLAKDIWKPGSKMMPEVILAFHYYLKEIENVLNEIKED